MIYIVLTSIILFYSLYMLLTVMIGMFYSSPSFKGTDPNHRVLVFYPIYKPTDRMVANVERQKEVLKTLNAKLFVLSQEANPQIEAQLKQVADYQVAESFSQLPGNSYHHALQYAVRHIENLDQSFDSILLLDPDNFMNASSIHQLVSSRIEGADIALSRRVSYSKDSTVSLFDGISERLNDYMFRRAKSLLRFHPELPGSGMLMDTDLFRKAVLQLDKKAPGMDKQLLIRMMFLKRDLKISYVESAEVMDEKTEQKDAFDRQRLRWFGNQYYNAITFGWKLLSSKQMAIVDYGISLWRPPRSFQLVGTVLLLPFDLMAYSFDWISSPVLTFSAILSGLAMILFLGNEGLLMKVISNLAPLMATSLKNGVTAIIGSMNTKGTFVHTRSNK